MGLFSGIAGGLIGGAIGAAIWAAISHYFNVEVGYVAWGVGILVGLGFRFLGGNASGPVAGISAALVAILSVLAGKWCAVALALGGLGNNVELTHEHGIARRAQLIAEQREQKGEKVAWPELQDDDAPAQERFPKDIWQRAEQDWQALQPDEQQAELDQQRTEMEQMVGKIAGALQMQVFLQSFNIIDLIFGLLAISTAYKMAANGPMESTPATPETKPDGDPQQA
jgi:hypothetical protein